MFYCAGLTARPEFRAINDDKPLEIYFKNNRNKALQFYWVDYQGNPRKWNELQPGQYYTQTTFATHYWIVTENNGASVIAQIVSYDADLNVIIK